MLTHPTQPLSIVALESRLLATAGDASATRCRWLIQLAELDARGAWAELGHRNGIGWLRHKLVVGRRAATEQLRVARALRSLPLITWAFSEGRVSYSKVRAITRIATRDTEQDLLDQASHLTAGQLERQVKRKHTGGGTEDSVPLSNQLSWRWAEDGSLHVRLRLTPTDGASLVAVLDSLIDQMEGTQASTTVPPRTAEPIATRRASALLTLVTNQDGSPTGSGRRVSARRPIGRNDSTRPAVRPARRRSSVRNAMRTPPPAGQRAVLVPKPRPAPSGAPPQAVPPARQASDGATAPSIDQPHQSTGTGRPGCSPPLASP